MPGHDPAPVPEDGVARFATIVHEHWDTVYRFVLGATSNPHDSEDLTQETFLRAWNRFETFQPGTNLRVWLLRIALNATLDVRRRRRRVVFRHLEHDPPTETPGPEHRLEVAEQAALLGLALGGLSERTRIVFHLRAQEDLSFREIAALIGTTEQGARWHMRQARVTLLRELVEKP